MKPSEIIRELFNKKAKKDNRDYEFLRASPVEDAIISYLDEKQNRKSCLSFPYCSENGKECHLHSIKI